MVAKKPVVRKRLVPDPTAVTPMARAVSVALTILETTKLPSWRALSEAVRQGEPKANTDLLTLDIDPATAALLTEQVSVLDLIRFGPGAGGKKPTTTTVLTCAVCARWLISTPISGTPSCVLTTGCTGKLVSAKKATKVGPEVDADRGPAPESRPEAKATGVSSELSEELPVESPDDELGVLPALPGAVLASPREQPVETLTEGPGLFD